MFGLFYGEEIFFLINYACRRHSRSTQTAQIQRHSYTETQTHSHSTDLPRTVFFFQYIWCSVSFLYLHRNILLQVGKFSSIILLNIFPGPLSWNSSNTNFLNKYQVKTRVCVKSKIKSVFCFFVGWQNKSGELYISLAYLWLFSRHLREVAVSFLLSELQPKGDKKKKDDGMSAKRAKAQ